MTVPAPPQQLRPADRGPDRSLTLVLADDHEVVRAGLRALLDASAGMRVVAEAGTGRQAVALAMELQPDVVIMDVSMPDMDGAAATEEIRRNCPAVRVLALTAHDDRAHLARLLQAGATGYVLKRGAASDLVRAIHAVASGDTFVDGVLAGGLLRSAAAEPRGAVADSATLLSPREEEVLRQIAWGYSNKEIGERLGVSTRTVETYKARIADKVGVRSRAEMVRYALRRGWLAER
ncbi:MAG TPA: response regulator transcription factor [Longimicrobiales bacterium]|nr:response regulator transcription factor [Longimicrobiales bacterium]